jgi:hypothetical protein
MSCLKFFSLYGSTKHKKGHINTYIARKTLRVMAYFIFTIESLFFFFDLGKKNKFMRTLKRKTKEKEKNGFLRS